MRFTHLVRSTVFWTLALALPMALASTEARAEDTHAVDAPAVSLQTGKPGKVSITVNGKNGWHVNEEAPISLKWQAPAGVSVGKDKLSRADLAESKPDRARFDVDVTCNQPGAQTLTGEARFVMCQESACKPVKETVTVTLQVAAAAADGDGKKKRR